MTIEESTTAAVDWALSTTRAVRLRLDLEREVDDEIILDCIDLAEQTPTGGNQGSRRWIIVRDPDLKERLAELYREAAGFAGIKRRAQRPSGNSRQVRVLRSALHLAEHLGEVPAIVIPTIIGRHDGSGRPGLFDSVIQSAWSFCLALRARGLGTAWTTVGLSNASEVKALLGIPPEVTEIAMFPVAWTIGTEFRPAPRRGARAIAYFDGYGRTYEHGPSTPPRLSDGPGVVVEIDIKAAPSDVWARVTDINMPADFSDEFVGADWTSDSGPALGATFVGRNHHEARGDWQVPCVVDVYSEGREFGWCTNEVANPGARWRFELEPVGRGTRLRFCAIMGPGPSGLDVIVERMPDLEQRIIDRRMGEHGKNMQRVIEGVKSQLESTS